MTIKFTDAAKYFIGDPHQIDAFEYLQNNTPPEVVEEFARRYRDNPKNGYLISKHQLEKIWNRLVSDIQIKELNECLIKFEINNKSRLCHFISQISHESGAGRYTMEIASGDAYEWREDLGNNQRGDGRRFKGAGYIQLTGRANYQAFANYMKDPRIMEGVNYVAMRYPFTSAGYFWMTKKLNDLVDSGASVEQITKIVNGGLRGIEDRKLYYKKCIDIIK